jgi:hypothetical protein
MCLVVAKYLICKHIGYIGIQKLNCQFGLGLKKNIRCGGCFLESVLILRKLFFW